MGAEKVYTLRWGIVATGWISSMFVGDLLKDPVARNVKDVKHVVAAVASRSKDKAGLFVKEQWEKAGLKTGQDEVKLYGDYHELYADPEIDAVYIGTPHSNHYQDVFAALSAGKNVLCEKSLTVNGKQAQALADLAREKGCFFMEAVWTRFQPLSYKVQEVIKSGVIGEVRAVQAELSRNLDEATRNPSHRMVNPDLAGGALLDLGPYPWTWLALTLLPGEGALEAPIAPLKVSSSIIKGETGVDYSTVAAIQFPQPDGRIVHGTLTTGLDAQVTHKRCVVVQGTLGYLEIEEPAPRPHTFSYYAWDTPLDYAPRGSHPGPPSKTEKFDFSNLPGGMFGFAWEADEVARCIRDGKKGSDRMPIRETVLMMNTFDEIRRQNDFAYPEAIESLNIKSA
ncbi:NAD-binding protein [Meredithblackwellia eburnea MCA 4105]